MSTLRSAILIVLTALVTCTTTTADGRPTAVIQPAIEKALMPDGVPETCPITKSPAAPFIPPAPYPATTDPHSFWFGTEKLWTILPSDGTWSGLPHYTPSDPTFRQKLFWWRQGYDVRIELQPKLRITGKRVDSSAPPILLADHASNGWQDPDQPFMVVGINIPPLGCWKITGHYEDQELSYVVWVTQ